MALTSDDMVQIGDALTHALDPVYEELDSLKKEVKSGFDNIGKQLGQLSDKVDAVTGDVIDLQDTNKGIRDQLVGIEEKLMQDKKDIKLVKRHIGLPI